MGRVEEKAALITGDASSPRQSQAATMVPPDHILVRYFRALDSRATDELVAMFAPDGLMITKGGTAGQAVQGHEGLREFYVGRGPATSQHIVTNAAQTERVSLAEGLVRPLGSGEVKFFLASALLGRSNLITRYTTLVWADITPAHEDALLRSAP
jgi:hypothetical protein